MSSTTRKDVTKLRYFYHRERIGLTSCWSLALWKAFVVISCTASWDQKVICNWQKDTQVESWDKTIPWKLPRCLQQIFVPSYRRIPASPCKQSHISEMLQPFYEQMRLPDLNKNLVLATVQALIDIIVWALKTLKWEPPNKIRVSVASLVLDMSSKQRTYCTLTQERSSLIGPLLTCKLHGLGSLWN